MHLIKVWKLKVNKDEIFMPFSEQWDYLAAFFYVIIFRIIQNNNHLD